MDARRTSRRNDAALLLLFVLLALAVYGPALGGGEYTCDGRMQIRRLHEPFLGEPALADRSLPAAIAVLADPHRFGPATSHLSWRPFTALTTLLADHEIFRETAALSLALNLVLHGLAAWLLFLCLRRMLSGRAPPPHAPPATDPPATGGALAGALLFLLHPLNSEAVLCAGFRPDLAATTLMLAMALLVLRPPKPVALPDASHRSRNLLRPAATTAAVAALFACALLFKEIAAAALVLVPLLVLQMQHRRDKSTGAVRVFPLAAALAAVFAVFITLWLRFRAEGYPAEFLGGGGRALGMANALTAVWEVYLRKLACPWPLQVDIVFEPVAGLLDARFLWALGGTAALLAAALLLLRHNRAALFGLAWAAVCILPCMQLIPIPDPVAERFAYAPMAGVAMAAGALVWQLWPMTELLPAARRAVLLAGTALALLYAGTACRRSFDWRTDVGLNIANWEETGDTRPAALENLGALYLMKADRERAEGNAAAARDSLKKAGEPLMRLRRTRPENVAGWRLGALCAWAEGRPAEARELISQALQLAPDDTATRQTAAAIIAPPPQPPAEGR